MVRMHLKKGLTYVGVPVLLVTTLGSVGCDREPVPITETVQESFRNYARGQLEDYHAKHSSVICKPEAVERMLDYAQNNESLMDDYDGRDFHILTEFLNDNPNAINHPIAVDEYVREIDDMIFDYCQRDYDEYVREAINLNWSNFLEFERKGELLNSIDSGKVNFLPYAIFTLDMEERRDAGDINPRYRGIENRPNLVEVAKKNIEYFPIRHAEAWYIATHLDEPIIIGDYNAEDLLINTWIPTMGRVWSNSAQQAQNDVMTLLENGSDTARTWIKIYANARFKNTGHDEDANEGAITDLLTIGGRGYRIFLTSSRNHAEFAGPLTQHDKYLLTSISDDEPFIESNTQSMTTLWTRKDKAIKDGMVRARLVLPNGKIIGFYP